MDLEYRKADIGEAEAVYNLVRTTKDLIYPQYYTKEVVDFFGRLHGLEKIRNDIENGLVYVLASDGRIIGTGSFSGNHITRLYVLPEYQGKGFGSYILSRLEQEIFSDNSVCELDASLPACIFYENRGYRTVKHIKYDIGNGAFMIYEIMAKHKAQTD